MRAVNSADDAASKAPPAARVLLFDKARVCTEAIAPIARILRAAVPYVELCHDLAELPANDRCDLLIANYDALTHDERDQLFDVFAPLRDRGRLLVYSRDPVSCGLEALFRRGELMNLLVLDGDIDGELLVTVQKILRRDIFGIEKYFPWGSQLRRFTITCSADRSQALSAVETFASQVGVLPRLGELLYTAADELVSNALYDAALDADRKPRYAHLSRLKTVELQPGEEVQLTLCSDGRRLGIAVADPFGTLTAATVRGYLAKCFQRGPYQIDRKAGGAGLGLFYTFMALSHLIINVSPGRCTEVIGLIDIRGSYKHFVTRGKSFNIFLDG